MSYGQPVVTFHDVVYFGFISRLVAVSESSLFGFSAFITVSAANLLTYLTQCKEVSECKEMLLFDEYFKCEIKLSSCMSKDLFKVTHELQ